METNDSKMIESKCKYLADRAETRVMTGNINLYNISSFWKTESVFSETSNL